MDRSLNVTASVVAVACLFVVLARLPSAPDRAGRAAATAEQRAMFAATVAGDESSWLRQAEENFPSDLWSQRDAFHGHEAQSVRDLAGGANVPYEEVIRAIDDDVHRTSPRSHGEPAGPERSARAIPCKPRPFYD